jgi:NitT/TauT family transport system substrate-binding protein
VSITGIGLGPTSVAAFERGKIDAGVLAGSGATIVQRHFPNLNVLADTRTAEGVEQLFRTEIYPAHDLIASTEWLRRNRVVAGKLAQSVLRAMRWMSEHSPEEIRDKMPAQYRAADQAADVDALREIIPMLSPDGRLSDFGAEVVRTTLAASSEKVRNASIDLTQTYTSEFIVPSR